MPSFSDSQKDSIFLIIYEKSRKRKGKKKKLGYCSPGLRIYCADRTKTYRQEASGPSRSDWNGRMPLLFCRRLNSNKTRRMPESPASLLRADLRRRSLSTRSPAMPSSIPLRCISLAAVRRMPGGPQTPPQASLFRSLWPSGRMASQDSKIFHFKGRMDGVQ